MSSVNLTTIDENEKKQIHISGGAMTGLIGVLILVVVLWAFLFSYKKFYLENNITKVKEEYNGYVQQLKDEDSISVIDFHRRLDSSKSLVNQGRDLGNILPQIESQIVPNVYLKSLSYEDASAKIIINCNADNFNTIAKQIYNFKKSTYFSSVTAGSSTVDTQTNRIDFPIELKINTEAKK
jgi:hypothetical protein